MSEMKMSINGSMASNVESRKFSPAKTKATGAAALRTDRKGKKHLNCHSVRVASERILNRWTEQKKRGKNLIEMDGGEGIEKSINKGKPISHSSFFSNENWFSGSNHFTFFINEIHYIMCHSSLRTRLFSYFGLKL